LTNPLVWQASWDMSEGKLILTMLTESHSRHRSALENIVFIFSAAAGSLYYSLLFTKAGILVGRCGKLTPHTAALYIFAKSQLIFHFPSSFGWVLYRTHGQAAYSPNFRLRRSKHGECRSFYISPFVCYGEPIISCRRNSLQGSLQLLSDAPAQSLREG